MLLGQEISMSILIDFEITDNKVHDSNRIHDLIINSILVSSCIKDKRLDFDCMIKKAKKIGVTLVIPRYSNTKILTIY